MAYLFFGFLGACVLVCIAAGLLVIPSLKSLNGRLARGAWGISWWLKAAVALVVLVVVALRPYQTGALTGAVALWVVIFIPVWAALAVAAIVRRRRRPNVAVGEVGQG